jgi:haloacetate dehalogenase
VLDGFQQTRIATTGAEINLRKAGEGPPLLLLHGYPQTQVMWHKIAPALSERFTVVLTDLRGYGDSAKPPGGDNHEAYSKRAMAQDQAEVMAALGFEKFAVAGHDRGARVGHRLALDHPDRVTKLALLDIAPTLAMYERADMAFASAYYHWFFLIQPFDLPERLIGAEAASIEPPWPSTSVASAIPRPSTPPARTTGRRLASIWNTIAPIWIANSPAPCSRSGAPRA